jgi:hypothetical protein
MIAPDVLQVLLVIAIGTSLLFALLFHFFDLEEADE